MTSLIRNIPNPIYYEYNSSRRRFGDITDYRSNGPLPTSGTIRLVKVNIPLTHNVIDSPNNILSLVEVNGNITRKIEVIPGNYEINKLCPLLSQLISLASTQAYSVTKQNNRLKIEAKDDFKLIYDSSSIWEQLGFLPRDSVSNKWLANLPPMLSPAGEYY